jgi:hypothetical protein
MRASFDGEVFGGSASLDGPPNPHFSGSCDELQGTGLLGSVIERAGEALAA